MAVCSEHTVYKVMGEKRQLEGASFSSPKRYKQSRETVLADNFDTEAMQCTMYEFYKQEYPILDMLLYGF